MKPNRLSAQFELFPLSADDPEVADRGLRSRCDRPSPTDGSIWAKAKARLGPRVRGLLAYLSGSTDLRVQVKSDRHDNSLFIVYYPVNQQRHTFSSEQALRQWADQRYYS